MRIFCTVLLSVLAVLLAAASVLLALDGNLARATGWYRFEEGRPLFSKENTESLSEACWMRIQALNDRIECERRADGSWWIIVPFQDRMSPSAAQSIINFTARATLVDTLPLDRTTRRSLREFGVESSPHTITIKKWDKDDGNSMTTIARYTLGSRSPWYADARDGEHLLPTTYLRTDFYGRDKRIHVVSGDILHLFSNGLSALRDPKPLRIDVEKIREIRITNGGGQDGSETILLQRARPEDEDWKIALPLPLEADNNRVRELLAGLSELSAVRVLDAESVHLPQCPDYIVQLGSFGENEKPVELRLYPPFPAEDNRRLLCYATVADRSVVFELEAKSSSDTEGSYAPFIKAVYAAPVLPDKAMGQILSGMQKKYVADLPLSVNSLRSNRFSSVRPQDVDRVSLRSRYEKESLLLLRIPGNAEAGVEDAWMFSCDGLPYAKADENVVSRFLKGLHEIPVMEFVADAPPGASSDMLMECYGLDVPDYVLSLLPKACSLRATLFGCDLPIVKDRSPKTYLLKRVRSEKTLHGRWIGMEMGENSIYQVRPRMTALFSFRPESWMHKQLLHFPFSSLRKITMNFQKEILELFYDYIGETWSGKLNGEDVSLRINSHRAEYYLRHLQKIRVKSWLEKDDFDALQALKNPAFSVKLNLQLTDYSDAEGIVVAEGDEQASACTAPVEEMLAERGEGDSIYRQIATKDRKTYEKTITIEIAPMDALNTQTRFYGRILETGALFTLDYNDAQSLAGDILEQ